MNLMELVAKISLDSSEYQKGLSGLGSAVGTVAGVASKAIAGASTAVLAFGKKSVDAGMQFDSAMSQVEATMGEKSQKMIEYNGETISSIEALTMFAQEMGASTAFSATEAGEALNYMALAGYDATTSMEVLPSVLNLASAGGIDLASASDMVTDALSAFGKDAEYASIMVDQMAVTSSNSNTSVEQLGEAFLTIGANAKSLSGGTAELSQMLGVLADNGIKGSEAGTHLRNIMLALNPTTDKATQAWEALGVNAYDADGNLRPLQDTFGDLKKAMEGMSDQAKTTMLSDMFNKTDLASINALLATEGERFDELAGYIADAEGSAETMAQVQLDNLAGDITLFQSALEGVQIAISTGVTPNLRKFVQLGSEGLGEIASKLQDGDIAGAFGALGEYLGLFIAQIAKMLPEVVSAGVQLLEALLQGISDNLDLIISSAMDVIMQIATAIIDNLPMILEAGVQVLLEIAQGIAQALPDLIPTIVEVVLTIAEMLIDNIDLLIDATIAIMTGIAEGLVNAMPVLVEKAPIIIEKLVSAFIMNIPKLLQASFEMVKTLMEGLVTYFPQLLAKIPQLIKNIVEKFKAGWAEFKTVGKNIVDGIWEGLKAGWEWLTGKTKELAKGLLDSAKEALGIHSPSREFKKIGEYCVEGFNEGIEDLMDANMISRKMKAGVDAISLSSSVTGNSSDAGIYTGQPIMITLQGDAGRLFRLVEAESSRNVQLVGG